MPRGIVLWSWIVLALLAAHDVTHLADEGLDTSPGQLALVAIPQWIALGIVMWVLVRDPVHRRTAALLLGASVVVGFAVIHLLPFSPAAFWDQQPSAVTWAIAWASIAVGVLLATLALGLSRAGGAGSPSPR